jgi:hypothetical protein
LPIDISDCVQTNLHVSCLASSSDREFMTMVQDGNVPCSVGTCSYHTPKN